MSVPVRAQRIPLVASALAVLVIGMWGGLLRMGWSWPAHPVLSIPYHGPLMIGGFLGTLISLERAVALGRRWTYGAALAAALGAVSLLAGMPVQLGQGFFLLASFLLVAVFIAIIRRQSEAFTWVMGLGALAWLVGNALWLAGEPIPTAVPWWVAFLVLTIVGERLELSRFLPRTPARQPTFLAAAGLYLLGLILGPWLPGLGLTVVGLGLLALAAWLVTYDLARRTVHQQGLTRFVAACLLCGYFWLALGGALAVCYGAVLPIVQGTEESWITLVPTAGLVYDALLHTVLLGFVIGMILGHAPIIFPAVLSVRIDYRPRFYGHLLFLQLSLLLRIVSDMAGWWNGRLLAGLLNALAIVLFLINTVSSVRFREAPAASPVAPSPAESGSDGGGLIRLSRPPRKQP